MAEENTVITQEQQTAPAPVKKNKFWLWLKRIVWTFIIFTLFILVTAGSILYFFGDKIKQYAIDQLNTYLATPVYVDLKNIDFTVLQNFPDASVDFRDVKALEVSDKAKKDELFHAGKISFRFNIMDIFHENYDIKKVYLSDVNLRLKVDKNGKDNFHFLKESSDTASAKFEFALEEFEFNNINCRYEDKKTGQEFAGKINHAILHGKFTSDNYELETRGQLFVETLRNDSTDYLPQKNLGINLALNVDNKNKLYTFSRGSLQVEDLVLEVTGSVLHREQDNKLNLVLKGKDLDIQSVLSLVPSRYKEKIKNYESEGDFYFRATVMGWLSEKSSPVIRSDFGIRKGKISERSSSVKLENVEMTGNYFNGSQQVDGNKDKKSALDIDNFSCTLGDGTIYANFRFDDLDDPFMAAKIKVSIGLNELQQFIHFDTIEQISGDLRMNAFFRGKIREARKYISDDFKNAQSSGELTLTNVNAKLKNNTLEFKNINGSFALNDNDMEIISFSGLVSHSDFEMKGYFRNILPYFFLEKENMTVEAAFHSKNIDLNELLSDKRGTSGDTAYHLVLPEYTDLNFRTSVDKLVFRKFSAANISGNMQLKDKKLIADPVTFKTMGGRITASVMIDSNSGNKFLITSDANLDHLNIHDVFYEFENFGQDYLQDKHLAGIATATVQFASVWDPGLNIDPDRVYAMCDIMVEKGELTGFSPFIEIADDLKKDVVLNKFIEVEEFRKKMEHIKFSTLQDKVEIHRQKISFAPMQIKSSAMDIDFSGTHTFNNEIDYHFGFILSQVFTKGEKRRKEENKEFGVEEDDGTGCTLYYTMTGTVDKPVFKKDYKTQKEKRREEIKKEKQNLRQLLRDEFGWFKKDSVLTNKNKKEGADKKDDNKFIINWDDEKKEKKKTEEDF